MDRVIIKQLEEILGEKEVHLAEPMDRHTTFRAGGLAEVYVEPKIHQVKLVIDLCKQNEVPYQVIGNGSNLLVSDHGLPGVVISFGRPSADIEIEGTEILCQAGAMLSAVAAKAAEASLTGMEFAAGIPGSIGGAVVMNAGAYGGEMKDIIKEVVILNQQMERETILVDDLNLSYRHSRIMEEGGIVLSARLQLSQGDKGIIRQRMEELKAQRIAKQPLNYPSAGSTFKRPEGYFAGKLIMDAGLSGYQVGGAQVSTRHCGFVVNTGNASASDIYQLICQVQKKVQAEYGVWLEPEVRLLGEF